MRKNSRYTFTGRVRFSEIGYEKRITLPGIIDYFQDCSIFQSEEIGFGIAYLAEKKRAWILSSWQVAVGRYPSLGEEIEVSTWATEFKGILASRNFSMTDRGGERIAYANSLWVYMNMESGRPAKPDGCEVEAYGTGEPLAMEYAPRKIALPDHFEDRPELTVQRHHIDTNGHVNNCQYVQMAVEAVADEKEICQMRAEYKRSAVYRDRIFPRVAREEERTVAALCDVQGAPYAIVEFRYR